MSKSQLKPKPGHLPFFPPTHRICGREKPIGQRKGADSGLTQKRSQRRGQDEVAQTILENEKATPVSHVEWESERAQLFSSSVGHIVADLS